MRWKVKAGLASIIAQLPPVLADTVYYQAQRRFGNLRTISPDGRFRAAIETWDHLVAQGVDPVGLRFCEIGTGWVPTVPIAYWLMGAAGTVTVDLHRYLREELVRDCLVSIAEHSDEIRDLFGSRLQEERLMSLVDVRDANRCLSLCGIEYIAPRSAAETGLPDASVDVHSSYTVLEHIPASVLLAVLHEAKRVLRHGGLSIHRIDYSDHFSHSDPSITAVNFLQFSDDTWARYAGHDYQYVNRLRHDDICAIFRQAGHDLISTVPVVNGRSSELLRSGTFRVDERFRSKPLEVLEITGAWVMSR